MSGDERPSDEEVGATMTPISLFFPTVDAGERRLDAETLAIAERRTRVVELYSRRWSMRAIQQELKCSLGTVHADLHAVLENYKAAAIQAASHHISQALIALTHRETQLELDLERSRGEAVETTTGRRGKTGAEFGQATVRKKGQQSFTAKLHGLLLQVWDRRCRLLGLLKAEDFRTMATAPVKLVAGFDPVDVV